MKKKSGRLTNFTKTSKHEYVNQNYRAFSKNVRKKPVTLKKYRQPSVWKLRSILLLCIVMGVILIVPTMIVMFPTKDEKTENNEINEGEVKDNETESDAFIVPVLREKTEEIEEVPLEAYVAGVVASEMPVDFEEEALKAQALAARTYVINHLLHVQEKDDAYVTDTTQHQVYHSEKELQNLWGSEFQEKMNKIKKAVQETKGEILTYEKNPITPAFFSTSNGFTENAKDYWGNDLPYLQSVKSPWDKDSPKFLDQKVFTTAELNQLLNLQSFSNHPVAIEIIRTDSQRVRELKVGDETLTGREVREKLNLQSSDFTIEQKADHFIFTTKGYGHGIGMSQYGANGMAQEGKTYKDIVSYYYQDIEITSVQEAAPALVAEKSITK